MAFGIAGFLARDLFIKSDPSIGKGFGLVRLSHASWRASDSFNQASVDEAFDKGFEAAIDLHSAMSLSASFPQ